MAKPSDRGAPPRDARKLFVNLPVRDLTRSMRFFTRLGFAFDARFTDDRAACLIISHAASVMLLTVPFFQTFSQKPACDTRIHVEGLFALSCRSRREVGELLAEAIAAGGTAAGAALDHGFMYAAGFHDLDGHHWQLSWTDRHTVYA
jgi:predicted lactoylglutathione lyase